MRNKDAQVEMTDAELRTLCREELKAPFITRLIPSAEANIGRVAVALAGEVVGSTEFVFLGHALRLTLSPRGADLSERASNASASAHTTSEDTLEIIGKYVDAYMDSRPKGSLISNPLFFNRSLEKKTYVSFLANLFGDLQNAVVCDFMGFDVVLNVGPAARKDGKLLVPRLDEGYAAESSRAAIAEFVDWLLVDPMYNVRAVPDSVERLVYLNVFELLTVLLAGALSTLEVDLMGRNVKVRVSEVQEKRDYRKMSRFRPKPDILRQFSQELSPVEAVQEVMCQVYAFVLAFAAFELSNVNMNIVGRKLSFRLAAPAADVLSPEDLEATMESEFNQRFRRALDSVVEEMLESAEDSSSGFQSNWYRDKLRGVLARMRGESHSEEEHGGEASTSTRLALHGAGSGGGGEGGGSAEIDMDSAIYKSFISHHQPPDDDFPFPYLTPDGFSDAVGDFVAALQPQERTKKEKGKGKVSSPVRSLVSVQKLSDAVDVNKDGVIAWGEYYFAAKEIATIFV